MFPPHLCWKHLFLPAIILILPVAAQTDHTLDIQPGEPSVCCIRSRYDGEVHKITINFTGDELDLASGTPLNPSIDGALWRKDETITPTTSMAVIKATTRAKEDFSAVFTVIQRKKMNSSTLSGAEIFQDASGFGLANQIQIHAYAPGGGTGDSALMPRASDGDIDKTYFGLIFPRSMGPSTPLKLSLNSKNNLIGENKVSLDIPPGIEVEGHPDWIGIKEWQSNTFQSQTIKVKLKENEKSPQTIKLRLENTKGGCTEDSVKLYPFLVKEVWSDQLADRKANGFPDKTGASDQKYALMGAQTSGKAVARMEMETTIPGRLQAKLESSYQFRFYRNFTVQSGNSAFEQQGSIARVTLDQPVNHSDKRYYIVGGFDSNANGQLEGGEVCYWPKLTHNRRDLTEVLFNVVGKPRFDESVSELKAEANASIDKYPHAAKLLKAFVASAAPSGSSSVPVQIARNYPGLTHPVGIKFAPVAEPGPSIQANFHSDSSLATAIATSDKFKLLVKNGILAKRGVIHDSYYRNNDPSTGDEIYPMENPKTFTWTWQDLTGSDGINFNPLEIGKMVVPSEKNVDLFIALGRVTVQGSVTFTVDWRAQKAYDISIMGNVLDIYDFDYDVNLPAIIPNQDLVKRAAEVQAGYSTLGSEGRVYLTHTNFDNHRTGIEFYFY